MSFPAFLDTCVLFSATLTDTLLRIAEEDAFRPLWSAGVLTELQTVLEREAGLAPERAARRIAHMRAAFPTAEVTDYESLVEAMTCDPKDRHVLAARRRLVVRADQSLRTIRKAGRAARGSSGRPSQNVSLVT